MNSQLIFCDLTFSHVQYSAFTSVMWCYIKKTLFFKQFLHLGIKNSVVLKEITWKTIHCHFLVSFAFDVAIAQNHCYCCQKTHQELTGHISCCIAQCGGCPTFLFIYFFLGSRTLVLNDVTGGWSSLVGAEMRAQSSPAGSLVSSLERLLWDFTAP